MIEGSDKIAKATAAFMDTLDESLADLEGAKVVNVMVIAEVDYFEDGAECNEVVLRCTTESRVYQRGIAMAALDAVRSGTPITDETEES